MISGVHGFLGCVLGCFELFKNKISRVADAVLNFSLRSAARRGREVEEGREGKREKRRKREEEGEMGERASGRADERGRSGRKINCARFAKGEINGAP